MDTRSLRFKRLEDGSVEVSRVTELAMRDPEVRWIETIPPNVWASIIADVSRDGRGDHEWPRAYALHMGMLPASSMTPS